MKYAEIAKELGVSFIRILEPRATGRFSNASVRLEQEQVKLLSEFAVTMNNKTAYRKYPVVAFFGYHQRMLGCFGAGNRYLYIDPNGDVHACPFCRGKQGNMLENPFPEIVEKIRKAGCLEFEVAFTG
jgi:MoaA/NifB/PqqE/SkfB family radical SAM enzyme